VGDRSGQFHQDTQPEFILFHDLGEMLAFAVDFTFNLGAGQLRTSTLRKRVNQRDWRKVAKELRRWVYGGGRVLPGLVTRREAEAELVIG
jgi:lysozyme